MKHPVYLSEHELIENCSMRKMRASGPGGQHRNKVETGIELTHRATGVQGAATERRSQNENRDVATQRLRVQLAIQIRTEPEMSFSGVWCKYLQSNHRVDISTTNWDWPIVLAEVLNRIGRANWELPPAAADLQTTPSQLLKLLKKEGEALRRVNKERVDLGLNTLKP